MSTSRIPSTPASTPCRQNWYNPYARPIQITHQYDRRCGIFRLKVQTISNTCWCAFCQRSFTSMLNDHRLPWDQRKVPQLNDICSTCYKGMQKIHRNRRIWINGGNIRDQRLTFCDSSSLNTGIASCHSPGSRHQSASQHEYPCHLDRQIDQNDLIRVHFSSHLDAMRNA